DTELVAAGLPLLAPGLEVIDGRLYISGLNGRGHVLEVSPDGASQPVFDGLAVIDVTAGEPGTLLVSECSPGSIYSLNLGTGAVTTLLDGLDCPTGLARADSGTLYYIGINT